LGPYFLSWWLKQAKNHIKRPTARAILLAAHPHRENEPEAVFPMPWLGPVWIVGFVKEKYRNQDSSILCTVHAFGTHD
jgi:hypothetical protein